MRKTKIDWADSTWNPVTGCRFGCDYCYARRIAKRFEPNKDSIVKSEGMEVTEWCCVLQEPARMLEDLGDCYRDLGATPYPLGFMPTFHRYRLEEPARWKKPSNIFVCSMGELFGRWVPDDWIREVFEACLAAPQHRYLFLTKNPVRYMELEKAGILPDAENIWLGTTVTTSETLFLCREDGPAFVSIEPILAPFAGLDGGALDINWIIVGAETGSRKNKVIPEKQWVMEIAEYAGKWGIPVFMKESLRSLMGDDFRQEYPWGEG